MRLPPNTPGATCLPSACSSTSASRPPSSTRPTSGWPGARARLLTTAAGPAAALAFAGVVQLIGVGVPGAGPLAFKLAFAWYLNTLFNLNPLMALDGYYLLMDWLEVPNLRTRAVGFLARLGAATGRAGPASSGRSASSPSMPCWPCCG